MNSALHLQECQKNTLVFEDWSWSDVMTDDQSARVLVSDLHLMPMTRFLLLSDSCGFVNFGRPLWREVEPVVHNCCWASPAQSFSSPSPTGLRTIFYCLKFETPATWRTRSLNLYRSLKIGVGVLLAADSQSTSKSGYRASLWDPWPEVSLLFFLCHNYVILLSICPLWRENESVVYSVITH
jgi:hypothetical protein